MPACEKHLQCTGNAQTEKKTSFHTWVGVRSWRKKNERSRSNPDTFFRCWPQCSNNACYDLVLLLLYLESIHGISRCALHCARIMPHHFPNAAQFRLCFCVRRDLFVCFVALQWRNQWGQVKCYLYTWSVFHMQFENQSHGISAISLSASCPN